MCNPMLAVAAFTAATQLYSGYQQNQMAEHQAKVTEDAAEVNAVNQRNEATRLRNIGTEKENDHRRAVAELMSRQAAQQGAAGIQLDTGSALQIREDTGRIGEVDALRIRRNYQDQATAMEQGADMTALSGRNTASVYEAQGKSALTNSALSAVGTVASSWYSPKSAAMQSNNVNNIGGGGNIHSTRYLRSQRV